ncbi:MAG: cytochrome o ubiquinol oxidase subunit I, partial [Proteobacteria bacterium]|nr:cytochrome o ubiquinol oxidase subunit I [Pseudomonadota bacterium]
SPPPAWNYAVLPNVTQADAYWGMKRAGLTANNAAQDDWHAIALPRRTWVGVVLAFFATVMGFALVWHIWWLAIAGVIGLAATGVAHAWRTEHEEEIAADVIAESERTRRKAAT